MRLKRPRPASADQVWITRESETVVIEYADRNPADARKLHRRGGDLAGHRNCDALMHGRWCLEIAGDTATCGERGGLRVVLRLIWIGAGVHILHPAYP